MCVQSYVRGMTGSGNALLEAVRNADLDALKRLGASVDFSERYVKTGRPAPADTMPSSVMVIMLLVACLPHPCCCVLQNVSVTLHIACCSFGCCARDRHAKLHRADRVASWKTFFAARRSAPVKFERVDTACHCVATRYPELQHVVPCCNTVGRAAASKARGRCIWRHAWGTWTS